MALSENQALSILRGQLRETYTRGARGAVTLGIGDDAAVLRPSGEEMVWTVDACQEGAHFLWEWMQPEDVAHKAFHAALSDVPAMGARPQAALCQLTLSSRVTARWLVRFAKAQAEVARSMKTPLVGGNICFGERVEVVTTVLGVAPSVGVLRRDGAEVGDEVWLIGEVGLARAGLLLLQKAGGRGPGRGGKSRCLLAFRRPRALLSEGVSLVGRAHACMDVSDGLARDAGLLATASGVRLELDRALLERVLAPELRGVAAALGQEAHVLALEGGEDYALLATGPRRLRPRFARVLGRVEKGKGAFLTEGAGRTALTGGYEHRHRTLAKDAKEA